MKLIITLTLVSSLLLAGSAMAQQGKWGQSTTTDNTGSNQAGDCTQSVIDMPFEDVSTEEEADLVYMREEEKLARDLYLSFYEQWGTAVFDNIAQSEQQHTNSIKALLTKYQIIDPVSNDETGVFNNSDLQQIYNDLLASGNSSLIEALKVGAAVEELDISDLTAALTDADNQDIKTVYQNLMEGSRNHLRSYVRLIEAYGQEYQAVYLTSEEVTAIVDAPM